MRKWEKTERVEILKPSSLPCLLKALLTAVTVTIERKQYKWEKAAVFGLPSLVIIHFVI